MRSTCILVTVASALLGGCVQPSSVQCGDGLVCPPGTQCAAKQSVCIKGTCGNGVVDPAAGEVCDDGNIISGDGCSADCKSNETCGNGIVDSAAGEVCDDGNTVAGDGCSADCKSDESCGNGIVDTARGEVCDDGNNVSGDGCSADCKSSERCGNGVIDVVDGEICDKGADNANCDGCSPDCKSNQTCGNGIVDACKGEVCDKGADNFNCDGCSPDCKSDQTCGNGIVDTCKGEVCDDGNNVSGDGCSADCKSEEKCGNGTVDFGEQCDPGPDLPQTQTCGKDCPTETKDCNRDCTIAYCGDTVVNTARGEQCDDGAESARCNADCTLSACGDGILNTAAGEQCDPGSIMTPICTVTCTTTTDCNTKECTTDSCTATCSAVPDLPNCNGNGAGAVACHLSACGDGYINGAAGETCDEPGGADSSGCNGKNAGSVACHKPTCGDGYVNVAAGEECDTLGGADTSTCNGSGAGAAACKRPTCGDGYINQQAGEKCDNPGGADTSDCNGKGAGAVACQKPSCGDGYANAQAGEACDTLGGADTSTCNGNSSAAVAVNAQCQKATCGDLYTNGAAGETCDNGAADSPTCNGDSAAAVTAGVACKAARCGDNYINAVAATPAGGEQCDDGSNNNNSGACLASCLKASCGDGYVETGVESCDVGSTAVGSGCSTCTAPDPGWACTLPAAPGPSSCSPVCGDGDVIANATTSSLDEVCDDGNMDACGQCSNKNGCNSAAGAVANAPAPATGSMTSLGSGGYRDGQAFTLSDGVHTLTFEFDSNSTIGAGNVPIDIRTSANAQNMACRICQAINGSGLNINANDDSAPDTDPCDCSNAKITLTNKFNGALGDVTITTSVTSQTFRSNLHGMQNGLAQDCPTGVGCTSNEDCASDICSLDQTCPGGTPCGVCVAPSCTDGKQNGDETDKDCGGGTCDGCGTGGNCISNGDCASLVCLSTISSPTATGICIAPTCTDKVFNGNETDVDCGGPDCTASCGTTPSTCYQCAVGEGCSVNLDCKPPTATPTTTSGVCDNVTTFACVQADVLDVVVTGAGSVGSTSPAGTLDTGDISGCTSSAGSCVQSYKNGASVTLSASSSAASGSITWALTGTTATCAACTVPTTAGSCTCAITLGGNVTVTVTTP